MRTKFMVGLRADRMTDQDIFALYRECLRVIGESETAAPAETDPQKIATALMVLGIPIQYVGVGEAVEDLRPFVASEFVEALFAVEITAAARVA